MSTSTSSARARLGLRLRTKWTLALLIVGLLPTAALGVRTLVIQRAGLESAERQLQVSIIDHAAALIDRSFDDAAEATHRVGRVLTEASITDDGAREQLSREAMARADALASVAIYGADGVLIDAMLRKGAPAPDWPKSLTSAERDAAGAGSWLSVEFASGRPRIRWIEAVERDGQRRAIVVGALAIDALSTKLGGLSRDRFEGRDDGVLLVDGERRVVVGGGRFSVGDRLDGRDMLAHLGAPPQGFAHEYAAATEFVDEAGTPMIGSIRSLPSRGFALIVRRPQASVFLALARAKLALIVSAFGIALFSVLAGLWWAGRITRPIRALMALVAAYGRRELTRASDVRTGDELEELGDSMTRMAENILAGEAEIERRANVEDRLSRFLPHEVAREISRGQRTIVLGGEKRDVTVLFADVVAFTPFAERAEPEQAVAFLNELFTVLSEVVFRHDGTIDKFIGDSIMAIFGAPRDQVDHVERALAAAEDMHRFVEATAPAWEKKYGFSVQLGIGISSGVALVGNLGSETRMEYTAIGDVVNVAARLEGLARAGQTLVTGEVAARSRAGRDEAQFHELGPQPLRGKKQSVDVLEVA